MFPIGPPEDTPGPTAYDVQRPLADGNTHKHYGFLDKSQRFKAAAKGWSI